MKGAILLLAGAGLLAAGAQAVAPKTAEQQLSGGQSLYQRWCATCHAAGPRMPGTLALEVKYQGARSAVLEESGVPVAMTTFVVRHGMGAMPRFRKTEISDPDLAAIAAYLDHPER